MVARKKELMNGRAAKETMDERRKGRKAPRAADLIGTMTKTKDPMKTKAKGKAKVKASGEQEHIGVHCPYKWTISIDEEDDQGSTWESELEGRKPAELASLEAPDDEGEWCWPKRNRITGWESERIKGQHSTTLQKTTEKNRRLDH